MNNIRSTNTAMIPTPNGTSALLLTVLVESEAGTWAAYRMVFEPGDTTVLSSKEGIAKASGQKLTEAEALLTFPLFKAEITGGYRR